MSLKRISVVAAVALLAIIATRTAWSHPDHDDEKKSETAAGENGAKDGDKKVAGAKKAANPPKSADPEWVQKIDGAFGTYLVKPLAYVLFYGVDVGFILGEAKTDDEGNRLDGDGNKVTTKVPIVVLWLLAGGVFFTLRMGFINFRGFWHAIRLTKGDYDDPNDPGEVSHFQALSSALSATVGLGNIGGVAIAVGTGGPGAVFWMILAGFFGMSMKFAECTLGQIYRKVDKTDGSVSGGPMHYLKDGLAEMGLLPLGTALAMIYAVMCIAASFGGGCAFQVGQSGDVLKQQIPFLANNPWVYGAIMVVLVGVVIIGGIRRIAATAGAIVPLMCGIYVMVSLYVLLTNVGEIVPAFQKIISQAFTNNGMYGGALGVMIMGIKRAVFSNEAGAGSAAIAHAAAKAEHPVSEGIVALLEPFIDTVIVCTMTGLVIVISGVYDDPQHAALVASDKGAALTSEALALSASWFPIVLAVAVVLFAYSTMISWSYYGERCWSLLFGARTAIVYRVLFLAFVFLGSVVGAKNVNDFSSLLILGLSFPNLLGVVLLSGKIKQSLNEYWAKYKSGELERNA